MRACGLHGAGVGGGIVALTRRCVRASRRRRAAQAPAPLQWSASPPANRCCDDCGFDSLSANTERFSTCGGISEDARRAYPAQLATTRQYVRERAAVLSSPFVSSSGAAAWSHHALSGRSGRRRTWSVISTALAMLLTAGTTPRRCGRGIREAGGGVVQSTLFGHPPFSASASASASTRYRNNGVWRHATYDAHSTDTHVPGIHLTACQFPCQSRQPRLPTRLHVQWPARDTSVQAFRSWITCATAMVRQHTAGPTPSIHPSMPRPPPPSTSRRPLRPDYERRRAAWLPALRDRRRGCVHFRSRVASPEPRTSALRFSPTNAPHTTRAARAVRPPTHRRVRQVLARGACVRRGARARARRDGAALHGRGAPGGRPRRALER